MFVEALPAQSAAQPLTFATIPPPIPGEFDPAIETMRRALRRWNITHACEDVNDVIPLAEAQLSLGMRPALLTPNGWFNPGVPNAPAPPVSLVHAWRKVRHWRSVFAREGAGQSGEILHAHCFSAAMAGVRAGMPVVYDVASPIGSTAPTAGTWLLRSLRVAENFVVSRAGAVVVHSEQNWNWALQAGARADDLFLIPEPIVAPSVLIDNTCWLMAIANGRPAVTFFANANAKDVSTLLGAFAVVVEEVEGAHLLIETVDEDFARCEAARLNIIDRVHSTNAGDRERALTACDVVITGDTSDSPNALAIDAFLYGRALLAADVPFNREVSPNGRGCVWFTPGSERDLAYRASFLARNPDFRAALGANGRAHIQHTRGPHVVARQYDDVYRHALKRHRSDTRPDIFHRVPILACC